MISGKPPLPQQPYLNLNHHFLFPKGLEPEHTYLRSCKEQLMCLYAQYLVPKLKDESWH